MIGADGRPRWVEVTVSGVPGDHQANGTSARLLRQIRSIEDSRRVSEDAAVLRSVVAASPDAMIITDDLGRCTPLERGRRALCSAGRRRRCSARSLSRLVRPDAQLHLARVLADATAGARRALARRDLGDLERATLAPSMSPSVRSSTPAARGSASSPCPRCDRPAGGRDARERGPRGARAPRRRAGGGQHPTGDLCRDALARPAAAGRRARWVPVAARARRDRARRRAPRAGWSVPSRARTRVSEAIDALYRNAVDEELPLVDGRSRLASCPSSCPGLVEELGDAEVIVGDLPTVAGRPWLRHPGARQPHPELRALPASEERRLVVDVQARPDGVVVGGRGRRRLRQGHQHRRARDGVRGRHTGVARPMARAAPAPVWPRCAPSCSAWVARSGPSRSPPGACACACASKPPPQLLPA